MSTITRAIALSQLVNDLNSGLTRYKKDDLGFGSIEKKYGLTSEEMKQVVENPILCKYETKTPALILIDDISAQESQVHLGDAIQQEVKEVKSTPIPTRVVLADTYVKSYEKEEAFI